VGLAVVSCRAQLGVQAPEVAVEVNLGGGLPNVQIVGMAETAVKEARDRVRAALQNAGFRFPDGRLTVNLAPADLPKDGCRFDLAIALGILAASGQVPAARLAGYARAWPGASSWANWPCPGRCGRCRASCRRRSSAAGPATSWWCRPPTPRRPRSRPVPAPWPPTACWPSASTCARARAWPRRSPTASARARRHRHRVPTWPRSAARRARAGPWRWRRRAATTC